MNRLSQDTLEPVTARLREAYRGYSTTETNEVLWQATRAVCVHDKQVRVRRTGTLWRSSAPTVVGVEGGRRIRFVPGICGKGTFLAAGEKGVVSGAFLNESCVG